MPRILSLNDSVTTLEFIHGLLEMRGHMHQYTTDSHQALSILRQERIELLIQDMLRRDMSGFELYWRMKTEEKLRDIPILIFSAWAPVRLTAVKPVEQGHESLYRAEYKAIHKEHRQALKRVSRIKDANVLWVEGYLHPGATFKLLKTVEGILGQRVIAS